jgi:hypothetical protein
VGLEERDVLRLKVPKTPRPKTMEIPSEVQIVATFDTLVSDGLLIYGPHQVIEYDCEGYPVSPTLTCRTRVAELIV